MKAARQYEPKADMYEPRIIDQGRKVQLVTLGKQPGQQVIVYDKTAQVKAARKHWWFDVWRLNKSMKDHKVWRIEVRAGKKCLKEKWNISKFDDLEASLGNIARYRPQT